MLLFSFTAFERKWRITLIVISSTVLILPIIIGFIQIFVKKTGDFHISSNQSGIQEIYKLVSSNQDTRPNMEENNNFDVASEKA